MLQKTELREMLLEQLSPIIETMLDTVFENLEQRLQEKQDANAPVVHDEILTFKEVLKKYKISATAFEVTIREHGLIPGQAKKKGNRRFLKSECDKILIKKML
jgi:hypothetical protein